MIIRNIALAAAAATALAPAISNASGERVSVNACASAFATSIASPGASIPTYKLAYRGTSSGGLADFYPVEYTFTLEAHDPKTGVPIARARCSVDSRGVVTEIAAEPTDVKQTLAAR